MKKNYFMLALASMMMAACANNDLVDEGVVKETPQAIGFETFVELPCGCCDTITIRNISETTTIEVENANLIIDRVA